MRIESLFWQKSHGISALQMIFGNALAQLHASLLDTFGVGSCSVWVIVVYHATQISFVIPGCGAG